MNAKNEEIGEPLFLESENLRKIDSCYDLGNGYCLAISKEGVLKSYKINVNGGITLHHTFTYDMDANEMNVNKIVESGLPKKIGQAWICGNRGSAMVTHEQILVMLPHVVGVPVICYSATHSFLLRPSIMTERARILKFDPEGKDFVLDQELTNVWLNGIANNISNSTMVFFSYAQIINNRFYIVYQHEENLDDGELFWQDSLNLDRVFIISMTDMTRFSKLIVSKSIGTNVVSIVGMSTLVDVLVTNKSIEYIDRDEMSIRYKVPKLKNNLSNICNARFDGDQLTLYCHRKKHIYNLRINLRNIYHKSLEQLKLDDPDAYRLIMSNTQFLENVQRQLLLI